MDSFKKFVVPAAQLEEALENLSSQYADIGEKDMARKSSDLSDDLRVLSDRISKFYRETSARGKILA
jgi:hypothetical protein